MKHVGNNDEKPSMRERWNEARVMKTTVIWLCLASVAVVVVLGFTWGGWMTSGGTLKAGEARGDDAVVLRLAPICIFQVNQDPSKNVKLDELNGLATSSQQVRYVQDQGWATMPGEERPTRNVVEACTKLALEMSP